VSIFGNLGFYWISSKQNEGRSTSPQLKFEDFPVKEVVLKFEGGLASEVRISLYNRADSEKLDEARFKSQIQALAASVDRISKVKRIELPALDNEGHVIENLLWRGPFTNYRIEAGFNTRGKVDPQFITLVLTPGGDPRPEGLKDIPRGAALRERLKTNKEGDVWLEIPMVHQGNTEAYCGPAAVERIMRYYGLDIDKYQIAEFAETAGTTSGTDPKRLFQGVQSLGKMTGLRPVMLREWKYDDFTKVCAAYNKAAAGQGRAKLSIPWGSFDIMKVYQKMDKEIFLSLPSISPDEPGSLMTAVADKIKLGVPIVWGVVSGMVEEVPPAPAGVFGHFRLIIGYNQKTSEILYTDTWGEGHEMKRMSLRKATAITLSLFSIE
jgi:hypothetical protein